jgi:hypothetical protein
MPDLQGQLGELRFTLQITRAQTGETEEVEMIGRVCADDDESTPEPEQE